MNKFGVYRGKDEKFRRRFADGGAVSGLYNITPASGGSSSDSAANAGTFSSPASSTATSPVATASQIANANAPPTPPPASPTTTAPAPARRRQAATPAPGQVTPQGTNVPLGGQGPGGATRMPNGTITYWE